MQTKELADLLNISVHSLRRWTKEEEYGRYLSHQAQPQPDGKARTYSEQDIRLLLLVSTLRDQGYSAERIKEELDQRQAAGWQNLPEIPAEWEEEQSSVSLEVAQSRAHSLATIAVLQNQIAHLETRNQETTASLQDAQQKVRDLEDRLAGLQDARLASEQEKLAAEEARHAIERQLLEAREQAARLEGKYQAEVASLEGQLQAYTLGREKPVNPIVLIALALLAGTLLAVAVFVIAALVGG